MASKRLGLHEDRVRVTFHLPFNNSNEERAVRDVTEYLKSQRNQPVSVKGFTRSELRIPVFYGYWWSPQRRRWIKDKIVLFFIDYRLSFSDTRLGPTLAALKQAINTAYADAGSPQDEIWLVAHQVVRQD